MARGKMKPDDKNVQVESAPPIMRPGITVFKAAG